MTGWVRATGLVRWVAAFLAKAHPSQSAAQGHWMVKSSIHTYKPLLPFYKPFSHMEHLCGDELLPPSGLRCPCVLPVQVSLEDPEPCRPCLCHPDGSTSQSCVSDDSQATPSTYSPPIAVFLLTCADNCSTTLDRSIRTGRVTSIGHFFLFT